MNQQSYIHIRYVVVILIIVILLTELKFSFFTNRIIPNYYSICMENINNYPYPSPGKPHLCCDKPLWNEEIRFSLEYLDFSDKEKIIVDFGANEGGDSKIFLDTYKPLKMHLVEPLPQLATFLNQKFVDEIENRKIFIHNVAIGSESKNVRMVFDGQGSSISDNGNITVIQRTFADMKDVIDMDKEVALVNINCEGCEWSLLEELITNNIIPRIKVIQFATHVNIIDRVPNLHKSRYCRIRREISKTHKMTSDSVFWAWERWIRHDQIETAS